jgi:hypothetical protein
MPYIQSPKKSQLESVRILVLREARRTSCLQAEARKHLYQRHPAHGLSARSRDSKPHPRNFRRQRRNYIMRGQCKAEKCARAADIAISEESVVDAIYRSGQRFDDKNRARLGSPCWIRIADQQTTLNFTGRIREMSGHRFLAANWQRALQKKSK